VERAAEGRSRVGGAKRAACARRRLRALHAERRRAIGVGSRLRSGRPCGSSDSAHAVGKGQRRFEKQTLLPRSRTNAK